ncbi:hypothetical protein [Humisphaera borealis]|uniref:Lipoprotein SmpA/OmlA domain-containing protein n=1 Tax=Humisphaera borealis TaxID=2807512 RepID=A0A7M2X3F1_9BACT|nr:hypothetical protein [Humisphaera borealis]QOV92288.1 hypothetical protein IPV69_13390 [Humisphaera borealis]
MIRTLKALVLTSSLLLAGGCASGSGDANFDAKIGSVKAGTPKSVVQRELGKPDEKKLAVAGATPAGLSPPTVQTGSRYETWTYLRGTKRFDIVMGGSTEHPGQWEVHSVSSRPADRAR